MRIERSLEGGAFVCTDKFIYIMNGSYDDHVCERYNISTNRWELVPTYSDVSG
jgi:hypothetical protein